MGIKTTINQYSTLKLPLEMAPRISNGRLQALAHLKQTCQLPMSRQFSFHDLMLLQLPYLESQYSTTVC